MAHADRCAMKLQPAICSTWRIHKEIRPVREESVVESAMRISDMNIVLRVILALTSLI